MTIHMRQTKSRMTYDKFKGITVFLAKKAKGTTLITLIFIRLEITA